MSSIFYIKYFQDGKELNHIEINLNPTATLEAIRKDLNLQSTSKFCNYTGDLTFQKDEKTTKLSEIAPKSQFGIKQLLVSSGKQISIDEISGMEEQDIEKSLTQQAWPKPNKPYEIVAVGKNINLLNYGGSLGKILRAQKCDFGDYLNSNTKADLTVFKKNPFEEIDKDKIYTNHLGKVNEKWEVDERRVENYELGYGSMELKYNYSLIFESSAKVKFQHSSSTLDSYKKEYLFFEHFVPKGSYNFEEKVNVNNIKDEVFAIFEGEKATREALSKLYKMFGQFIPTEVLLGGRRWLVISYYSNQLNAETKQKILGEVRATLKLGIHNAGGGGGYGQNSVHQTVEVHALHKSKLECQGGDNPENASQWLDSLNDGINWHCIQILKSIPTHELLYLTNRLTKEKICHIKAIVQFIEEKDEEYLHKDRSNYKSQGNYFGQLKDNGIREGKGIYKYENSIYEGDWKNNKREGKGRLTMTNGEIYTGFWKDDAEDGLGKHIFANGEVYEGMFKNNQIEGKGKMLYKDGAIYDGNWVNNKRDGLGYFTSADGTYYKVEFDNEKNIYKLEIPR